MDTPEFSVVLPFHRQADHVAPVVDGLVEALGAGGFPAELVLVPNGPDPDGTGAACAAAAARHPTVRCVPAPGGGGGLAVRTGLAAARGARLCFTNSARVVPEDLLAALALARRHPEAVVQARRARRESWVRELGTRLYNLECRLLFGLASRDLDGTPKVFPRRHLEALGLASDGPLLHLEFCLGVRDLGLERVEFEIPRRARRGGTSTTGPATALGLYLGALGLWLRGRR